MPGFPPKDHARVSAATVWVERNKDNRSAVRESTADRRGLVRVMLLDDINFGDPGLPNPVKGDFPVEQMAVAVITEPILTVDYLVRCVASEQDVVSRTWQLNVIPPGQNVEDGILTAPIAEHASADEVRDILNATGCPPVEVAGAGRFVMYGETPRELPPRQWQIQWPDSAWSLSTLRLIGETDAAPLIEYDPGGAEVPIMLQPTIFAPTGVAESVWLPFHHSFSVPTPGTFALCQVLPGLGLVIVKPECWSYVD
jgi:hypothetical protein